MTKDGLSGPRRFDTWNKGVEILLTEAFLG